MRLAAVALAAFLAAPFAAAAQHVDMVGAAGAVQWGPAPPSLPKGAELAVLSGDPTKAEPYVLRLKMPANYVIPAHHHPTTENVTVLTGTFHAGMGDKLDRKKAQTFTAGGFAAMPAGMNHYAWASRPTVVQVHGMGPFVIEYVNPADDPSKAP